MKSTYFILLIFLCLSCISCTQKSKESGTSGPDQSRSDSTSKNPFGENFSQENILDFGGTLTHYFTKVANVPMDTTWMSFDTVFTDSYTQLNFRLKNATYRSNGYIMYSVYFFDNQDSAKRFYDDLKTIELVADFGLNKRPNHILWEGDKVYWHHYEHWYGHRYKELNEMFSRQFLSRPRLATADSVSGFTYCKCINEDANAEGLRGKWQVGEKTSRFEASSSSSAVPAFGTDSLVSGDILQFTNDAIVINGNFIPSELRRSLHLPNNKLYWKYTHYQHWNAKKFTAEYKAKLRQWAQSENPISEYSFMTVESKNHFSIVVMGEQKALLSFGRHFFELKKIH